ncbi:MAG: hypothetical protein ACTS2F_01605 [Thainema sp.]
MRRCRNGRNAKKCAIVEGLRGLLIGAPIRYRRHVQAQCDGVHEGRMMRKLFLVVLSGAFALSISGCQLFGGGGEDQADTSEVVVPVPEEPAEAGAEAEAEEALPTPPEASDLTSAELIQSTDADARVQQISSGVGAREDPFANLPIPPPPVPVSQIQPGTPGGRTAPGGGATPGGRTPTTPANPPNVQPRTPNQPGPGQGQPSGSQPGGQQPSSPLAPGNIAVAPTPSVELATAVVVTGVVEVGGVDYAIVDVPNEPSRYVREGQRIANGQVLVKRIEVREGGEPRVILEQNGVEVARRVGEGAVAEEATA